MTTSSPVGDPSASRPRLAVVGGGVAGIVAAWKLSDHAHVTIFENDSRLGGHTHTVEIPDGPDAGTAVDTGFIVLNDATYPHLQAFLAELGVPVRFADMSFGYHDEGTGFQYSGRGLRGLLADPANLLRPDLWRMVADFRRFNREASRELESAAGPGSGSLGRYLRDGRYSRAFVDHYLLPMGAAIWSAGCEEMLEIPLEFFLRFFQNHGLLRLAHRPRWQTVAGGSHAYVERFRERFAGTVVESAQVFGVTRQEDGISIHRGNSAVQRFDGVVLAVHADLVPALLGDADHRERKLFGRWRYQENRVVLHHDTSVLPGREMARASWNFTREREVRRRRPVSVTYDMVRLQGLSTRRHWLTTLNREARIDPSTVVREMVYHHPVFTRESIHAIGGIRALEGSRRTWFTGSYFGFGFHEDAVRASVDLVARLFAGKR
jgi:predicted NAD/FAD-binding protein